MIVSSSANNIGYIFDSVVSVIVRIYICRLIGVHETDTIGFHTTCVSIGIHIVRGDIISRWFRDCLRFSDSPIRPDAPDLTAVARPEICLLI